MQKTHFLLLKKLKNTSSAQLCCCSSKLITNWVRCIINPSVPKAENLKIRQFNFKLTFAVSICKGNGRFWHSLLWALWTKGLKRSVLAVCNICFLKAINLIEVQKYLFGINGLNSWAGHLRFFGFIFHFKVGLDLKNNVSAQFC